MREPGKTPLENFRSKDYRRIRQQLLADEWPKECSLCESYEKSGRRSHRLASLQEPEFSHLLGREDLTDEPEPLSHLELSFDNLCNLKCRMCSPAFSTRWNEDLPELRKTPGLVPDDYFTEIPAHNVDLDSLLPHLDHLKALVVKGGEPMINKKLMEFLRRLVETGRAEQIQLRMVTNGTVIAESHLRTLQQFRRCSLTVSVDGADPLFSYIRHGRFQASHIKKNLDKIVSARLELAVTTAFQVYNMLTYDKIVGEFSNWTNVFLVSLVTSHGLSSLVAPDPVRLKAINRIQPLLELGLHPISIESFRYILSQLKNAAFDYAAWQTFKKYTAGLDRVRDEKLADVSPELASYWNYSPNQSFKSFTI